MIVPPFEYLDAADIKIGYERELCPINPFVQNMVGCDQPKMVIMLAHHEQMYRVAKFLQQLVCEHTCCRNFRLVLDESHITCFNDRPSKSFEFRDVEDVNTWPEQISQYHLFRQVQGMDKCVGLLTSSATASRNFFNGEFPIYYIIHLQSNPPAPGTRYVGVADCRYSLISDTDCTIDPHEDPDIYRIASELAVAPIFHKDTYNLERDHPIFHLIQVSRYTNHQREIADRIGRENPDIFTIITYNDKGIRVNFTSSQLKIIADQYGDRVVVRDGKKVFKASAVNETSVFFKSHVPLPSILDLVVEVNAQKIILVAGDMLKQGRRVNDSKYTISLTSEFLRVPPNSTMDDNLQKLRCVGYKWGTIPVEIYTTENLHSDLIRAYTLNAEITNILKVTLNGCRGAKTSRDILFETKLSRNKKTSLPLCKERTPMPIINKEKDDFPLDSSAYFERISDTLKGREKTREKTKVDYPRKYYDQLKEKIPNWIKRNANIGRLLRQIEMKKIYCKEEIEAMCVSHGEEIDTITETYRVLQAVKYKKGGIYKSGYRLYPKLIKLFQSCFG